MKTSNYLYVSHSQMYGMLHGMYTGGCLDNIALEDAKDIAYSEAYDIVTGYTCIIDAIHEDINNQLGYGDTPEKPDEEYLDALEDAIQEECVYSLWEITSEDEAHWDKMENDPSDYESYEQEGWIIRVY